MTLRKAETQGNWHAGASIHTSLSQHKSILSCKDNRNPWEHTYILTCK